MRRRAFIVGLAGGTAWLFSARAQQPGSIRRISLLMLYPERDPQGELRARVFQHELERAGWTIGGNVQLDFRWGTGDADWVHSVFKQIVGTSPDVILANGDTAANTAKLATRTIPVIFIGSGDPVADGLVESLAHPGANLTGFAVMEPTLGAKLLGILKQVAPQVGHVGVLVNPDSLTHRRIFALLTAAAPQFTVDVVKATAREDAEIQASMSRWSQQQDFGLIVPSDPVTNTRRQAIIALATQYRMPAIYALRAAAADGGLMSYGVDIPELFRQSAIYADRILKGAKPTDLPVQLPTKFELVINRKAAKTLGLTFPENLLATADEVIE